MKTSTIRVSITALCLVLASGCKRDPAVATPPPAPKVLLELVPIEFKVKQRTTTGVQGSKESLLITIDDITRNQVRVSLGTKDGSVPMPVRSMSPESDAAINYGAGSYEQ